MHDAAIGQERATGDGVALDPQIFALGQSGETLQRESISASSDWMTAFGINSYTGQPQRF